MEEITFGINIGDGRVALPGISAELGTAVFEPDEYLAQFYQDIIKARDPDALDRLINDEYPHVLWGGVRLTPEDRKWVREALEEKGRQRKANIWGEDWEECD